MDKFDTCWYTKAGNRGVLKYASVWSHVLDSQLSLGRGHIVAYFCVYIKPAPGEHWEKIKHSKISQIAIFNNQQGHHLASS